MCETFMAMGSTKSDYMDALIEYWKANDLLSDNAVTDEYNGKVLNASAAKDNYYEHLLITNPEQSDSDRWVAVGNAYKEAKKKYQEEKR